MIKTRVVWVAQHGTWTKFGTTTATKMAIVQAIASNPSKTSFGLGDFYASDWD